MTEVAMDRVDRADREGTSMTVAVPLAEEGMSTMAPMPLAEEGT